MDLKSRLDADLKAAMKAGALSQYCLNWEMALMTVGLGGSVEDPLPDLLSPPDEDALFLD